MRGESESELVQRFRDVVLDLLNQIHGLDTKRLVVEEHPGSNAFVVSVPKDTRTNRKLYVVVRKLARPSHFERLAAVFGQAPKHALPVLATPTLSTAVVVECGKRGWGHLDSGGNCRLSAYPLHIEREGRPIPSEMKPPKQQRSFDFSTEHEAIVVRSLVGADLGKSFTDRDVVRWCAGRASLGYVCEFLRFLKSNHYLEKAPCKPGFVMKDLPGLFQDWTAAQAK